MVAFSRRHPGYKIGVVSLYFTTILFYVGNFAPEWLHHSQTETNVPFDKGMILYRDVTAYSSVLAGCREEKKNGTFSTGGGFFSSDSHGCGLGYYIDSKGGGWVHACQAFEVIAVIGLLLACIYTIWVNFCKAELGPKRRYVEIVTVAAGVLGFLGCIIFLGKLGSTVSGSDHYSFAWSLFFTIVVSVLVVVVGVVIAVFNRADDSTGPYDTFI